MNRAITRIFLVVFTVSFLSCSQSDETPFPQKLEERIVLQDYRSTIDKREVSYWGNTDKIKFQKIYLRNGNFVDVTHRQNETISEIVEYFFVGGEKRIVRLTKVDESGKLPLEDSIFRKDGTLEHTGKSIVENSSITYKIDKFFEDGESVRMSRKLVKVDGQWLISNSNEFYPSGITSVILKRLEDKTYKREFFTEAGKLIKTQYWNTFRTVVKTIFYADDGKTAAAISTESAGQKSVLFYHANGYIKQLKDKSGSDTSLTAYDGTGNALFRQVWRIDSSQKTKTDGDPYLVSVDVIKTGDGVSRKYYFFPEQQKLQILIEQSETEKDGWRKRTRMYNQEGWLVSDQTINEVSKVIENKKVKINSVKHPKVDSIYLLYKPMVDPPSQLSSRW